MFKVAVLLSVLAVALAKPNVYSLFAYESVVPALKTLPSYTSPTIYNVAPVARVAPVAPIAPVAPVVTSPYRYVPQYYEQPGYVGVPFQSQVVSGAVPYYAGSRYHALLKRSSEEKKN